MHENRGLAAALAVALWAEVEVSIEPFDAASRRVAGTVLTIVSLAFVVTDVTRPRNPYGVAGP
jgi:formate-dependent nitrite reductase membrane component NrfD